MPDQQDYYYVFTRQGDLENPDETFFVGPFEDRDGAEEYIDDRNAMTDTDETNIVVQLDDSDAVLAALKKKAKKAKKKAKKEAKHQKSVKETIDENDEPKDGKKDKGKKKDKVAAQAAEQEGNGGKKGKGKKDKAQPATAEATSEDDASDDAAPSTEGAAPSTEAPPEPLDHEGETEEVRRRRISEAASKRPYAGQLADKKDELIEEWARNYANHEVLGPLKLSPQQRRVIAALKWQREVSFANAHMPNTTLQPAPVIGIDANGRIVVQQIEVNVGNKTPRQWAVYKNGNAADIKEPVTRLKHRAAENV
jgi:hypothetical protein